MLISMKQHLNRFSRERVGSIAILAAVHVAVGVVLAAVAVDFGSLYLERRHAQGVADLAAIAAANDLTHAQKAAEATIAANNLSGGPAVKVVVGQYVADIKVPPQERFRPGRKPYNAAQVFLTKNGQTYFGASHLKDPEISVVALASSRAQATFSVGSRLLGVRDGLPNAVLSALLGGNVTLSAMDYNALLSADVTLGDFLNELALDSSITAGTYNDLLDASVTMGHVLQALASVTNDTGQSAASLALTNLTNTTSHELKLTLDQVINLGPIGNAAIGGNSAALSAAVDAMGILTGSAVAANGSNQLSFSLGLDLPGLADLSVTLAVGEPAQQSGWVSVGQPGSEIYTAQTRLRLVAKIGGSGVLASTTLTLPIAIDVASAAARLDSLTCGTDQFATIGAVPGIVEAWIGTTQDLATWPSPLSVEPAKIISTPVLKVTGSAHAFSGRIDEAVLQFDQTDIDNGTIKSTDSNAIATSLVTSLVRDINLRVDLAGLSLVVPSVVQAAVADTLQQVAKPLDKVVYELLKALGVHLGEADVKVHGIRCQSAALDG